MASSDKPVAPVTHPDILALPLDRISVGPGRHRQDMGDLKALADSMDAIGLLQPIGVTADFALVFGERRMRAAGMLRWTTIAARIVDLPSIVAGEYAENEIRKDFTPSERVAIAGVIRTEIGSRQGRRTDHFALLDRGPEVQPGETTRDVAARKAGFESSHGYRLAKTVVERGAPNVVEAMDGGEVSLSAAARAVKAAPKEQQSSWTVADIRRAAKEAAIGPEPLPTPKEARERSRQTGALVLASDGNYHAYTTPEEDRTREVWDILRFSLLHDLPPPDPADAVACVPAHMRDWVTARAADRLTWFQRFTTLWRERHAA
jgi:ParB-like chromosome segregation protein Spo0J